MDGLDLPTIVERQTADPNAPFLPFGVKDIQRVPDFLPIGGDRLVRQTSSTHGTNGYITTDPEQIALMQERLDTKITQAIAKFTYFDETIVPNADTLVIAYGVTARAAKAAVKRLQGSEHPTSLLVLKTPWPLRKRSPLEGYRSSGAKNNLFFNVYENPRPALDAGARVKREDNETFI